PIVQVQDGNFGGHGELSLKHVHEGVDLRVDWAKDTLKNIFEIWKKPVHIETMVEGIPKSLSFDGEEHREQRMT
ncbi:MAG: SpoVR family protein, partial [Deltaproteobacteria bacterium]|nr:SpoVR family protein [Deltaproteobacteria bacterium]